MKKICLPLVLLIFALFFAIVSCKKESSNLIKLTYLDTGKVINVQKGEVINITLSSPVNPNYSFGSNWQYNTNILSLTDEKYLPAADPKLVGGPVTKIWTFSALTTGTTALKLGYYNNDTKTFFSTSIKVE